MGPIPLWVMFLWEHYNVWGNYKPSHTLGIMNSSFFFETFPLSLSLDCREKTVPVSITRAAEFPTFREITRAGRNQWLPQHDHFLVQSFSHDKYKVDFHTPCTLFPPITFSPIQLLPRCLHLFHKPSPNHFCLYSHDTQGGSPFSAMVLEPYLCLCLTWDHHKWFGVTKIVFSYSLSSDSIRECLQPNPHLLWNHRLAWKGSLGWEAVKTRYIPERYWLMPLYKLQYYQKYQETLQVVENMIDLEPTTDSLYDRQASHTVSHSQFFYQFLHNLPWLPHRVAVRG